MLTSLEWSLSFRNTSLTSEIQGRMERPLLTHGESPEGTKGHNKKTGGSVIDHTKIAARRAQVRRERKEKLVLR